jgi:hypothetical protein
MNGKYMEEGVQSSTYGFVYGNLGKTKETSVRTQKNVAAETQTVKSPE